MALLAAARHDTANHLARALVTNREIGVAMGILMANGRLTESQGFDQLRTPSQNFNRRLRDIAADVALTGRLPRAALKLLRKKRIQTVRSATLLERTSRSCRPRRSSGLTEQRSPPGTAAVETFGRFRAASMQTARDDVVFGRI